MTTNRLQADYMEMRKGAVGVSDCIRFHTKPPPFRTSLTEGQTGRGLQGVRHCNKSAIYRPVAKRMCLEAESLFLFNNTVW